MKLKEECNIILCFKLSTLHSFAWTLIQPYTKDIKDFLFTDLSQRIEEYEQKQATGRKNSQAYQG